LTPDIVDYLREMLAISKEWQPLRLFKRLNQFWEEWCEGKFIDRTEDNLPQKKMKILKEQMPEREIKLGIRQVDVYTGLNILILLLELHRYAQGKDELKDSIVFYPSGKSQADKYAGRLMKAIHYSESIESGIFDDHLQSLLSGTNLSHVFLSASLNHFNFSDVNFSNARFFNAILFDNNFSDADFSGASLGYSYFTYSDFSNADFSNADCSNADFSDADFSGANFRGADFSGARLSNVTWDEFTNWEDVKHIDAAIDVPEELKEHLGLN
jgi:Pentapeptide repeats (8 copies)